MVARVLQALGMGVLVLTALIALIAWLSGMDLLLSMYLLVGGLFGSVILFFGMAVLDHLKAIRDALEGLQPEVRYLGQEDEVEHYTSYERNLEPYMPYGVVISEWHPRKDDWL